MRINHNLASLNTYRQMGTNSTNTQKSLEKLSSGLRINKAGDDAAGLAISEKMRGQIRGLDQASRNSQDGISMIQTSEGALAETQSILQRMKELATQSANGTNTESDRGEIQKEINQLSSEINRIGNTTEFNTQKLLKGTTAPVVETAVAKTTIKAGEAGVAAGAVSDLAVDTSSVKKVNSQATVQASSAAATGTVSAIRTTNNSIKGAQSAVTLANGVSFESKTNDTALNDRKIVIEQSSTAGSDTTVNYANGTYTFTVGQTDGGVSKASNRGELYNQLNSALQVGMADAGFGAEIAKISLKQPTNTSTAVTNVATSGTMANGRTETNGVFKFDLTDKFEEAGDSITIDGETFTSVLNNAIPADGKFAVGANTQVKGGTALTANANAASGITGAVTGTVTIKVAGQDFTITQAALRGINDTGSTTTRLAAVGAAVNSSNIALSTVADVAIDGGALKITAKNPQAEAITWTANGDVANRQLINETFGMNTMAKLTGAKGVEPTADLDGIKAAWDTGDITATLAGFADGDQATFSFNGVTVAVHGSDALPAIGQDASTLNFTDTSLRGTAAAKIDVFSSSTVHMYYDTNAAADGTANSAAFAKNLAAAFNAAKHFVANGDVSGAATGALADYTIGDAKGTYVDADSNNMGRVVFSASEALGETPNALQITKTGDAGMVIANSTTAQQQQAVWDSGDLTRVATGDTKTFTFGGVTVNITGVAAAGSLVGSDTSVANTAYGVTGSTINLTIDNSAVTDNGGFAAALAGVLEDAKVGLAGAVAEFDDFTYAGANGTDTTSATGHLTITRDSTEKLQSTYEMGGTLNISYVGAAAQRSTGAGREGMIGTDGITSGTTASFIVDGHEFTISNADLKSLFDENSGANTSADVLNLVSSRALDSKGNALSTAASVTMGADNKIVFTSLTEGSTSSVEFKVNSGAADTVAQITNSSDQVKRALGIDNGTAKDAGESSIAESLSTTSQANSIVNAINANEKLGARFTASVDSGTSTIVLTEKLNQAAGTNVASPVVAGAGSDDKLVLTNTNGENFKTVTIAQSVTTVATAAKTDKIDDLQATAAAIASDNQGGADKTGTEINGLKIAFGSAAELTYGAGSTALTAEFDAATFSIKVTGNINSASNPATSTTAMEKIINETLKGKGFETGINFNTDISTANLTGIHGKTIEFGKANDADAAMGKIAIASNDTMAVSQTNGNITINLANASSFKNTADNIQQLVKALGTTGYTSDIDFAKYEFKAEGQWDTNTLGNSIKKDTSALVGGIVESKGVYSFDVTKSLAEGDIVEIGGKAFKAVASNPNAANNEFEVAAGDTLVDQAVKLADAVGSAFTSDYTVTAQGSKVILTENTADGVDMKSSDLEVRATGTAGEFSVAAPEFLTSGAKFVLDGQEISVSNKNENVGYTSGTAIKETASAADQTKALANAINTNANLKNKYTASVGSDGSLTLKQTASNTTSKAPEVSTKSSAEGDFTSTFQVGANSGQSMTVEIADMRSVALGITGDGSTATVKSSNGFTASYVTTANVTNGTTNSNVEFALDVSTHEKATAAIGVLEDAISAVSAQRSQLGSYQNRLEHTINNLGTSSENLTAAESRVRDVDMAKEMMEFTKNNILSQAAQAMMAQANQQPQGVLQLLR